MKKVGVLAVQGAFIEHENILNKICVETFEIRQKKDLERDFDGLIIPGGESTVIGKLENLICKIHLLRRLMTVCLYLVLVLVFWF